MSRLHFNSETVGQEVHSSVHYLSTLNDEQFEELILLVLNFLSQQTSELAVQVASFAQTHTLPTAPLKKAISTLIFIFKGAVRENLTPALLQEDLVTLGLSEERAAAVGSKWRQKLLSLSRTVIGNTLTVNQVVDMEWKFGVTAASSDLAKVGTTYLQLKLVLDKGNNTTETAHMELTLQQFYHFLHEMQKARSTLEYFN